MPAARERSSAHAARQRRLGATEQQSLLAIAGEPRLHEQLHVALAVGAGYVESHRAPLCPVAQEVLDHTEARVARVARSDGVELDDRPLVPGAVPLDTKKPGDSALVFVDEEEIVWPEGAQGQPEQAEHSDAGSADRQPERARVDVLELREPRQFPQRREIG